ncbi:MAG: HAD family phosphatase [Candidatus Saccharimonadales bacterium]
MSRIDTIFFDWGGVIADDPGDDFLLGLLRKIGATDQQAQEIYNGTMRQLIVGTISEAEYWHQLRQQYNLTVHENMSDEFKAWRGLIKNENVLQLVDEARHASIRPALLTNVIEPTYNVLEQGGNYKKFDEIIASCRVGLAKPQPEIYALALERMGTTAERSLFIDDKLRNIQPARDLGFHTILAKNPTQIISEVRAYFRR